MKDFDTTVSTYGTADLSTVDKVISILMPDIADNQYDNHIKDIFKTLLSLTPSSFMNFDFEYYKAKPLPDNLNEIFLSYNRYISNPDYKLRAFIASLYDVKPLDLLNISNEWLWLGKLCHLLFYYSTQNPNINRIQDICTMARLWHNPIHIRHDFWSECCKHLQANTLKDTYHAFDNYLKKLINTKAFDDRKSHTTAVSQFRIAHRILAFAYRHRDSIHRTASNTKTLSLLEPRIAIHEINDDNADTLIAYGCFEYTTNDIDSNREKLDNNPIDFMLIKQDSLRQSEQYSAAQMYRRTQSKFNHANQNEMLLASSLRHLSIYNIKALCKMLWQCFCDGHILKLNYSNDTTKKCLGLLLLSLYTGRTITEINADIQTNAQRILCHHPHQKTFSLYYSS